MKAVFLLVLFLLISSAIGGTIVGRLRVLRTSALEFAVYSLALGMGIAAYGILALGLIGQLSFWPVTVWWLALAGAGLPGARLLAVSARSSLQRKPLPGGIRTVGAFLRVAMIALLVFFTVVAILLCFRPPGGHEWDALAYHLADPKVFLADHRITSLPTEHHSNFPFTVEMLFTVALLYDGYALANLVHLSMAATLVLFLIAFGTRMKSPMAGLSAGLLFASTPLTFWQATSAYIDVGSGLFTTLGICAAVCGTSAEAKERRHWLVLSGLMMGFALGTKYLALLPFAIVFLLLLVRRCAKRDVAVFAVIALAVGSPWYIKNVVWTQNPVYPFFYRAFPHSRYWSADRAAAYQSEQDGFGYPHSLKNPAEAARNLLESPWRLLTHGEKYANAGDFTISVMCGGLFAAYGFGLFFVRRPQRFIRDLLAVGVCQLVAWFLLAQIGRYLVSLLPIFALVSGYVISELAEADRNTDGGSDARGRLRAVLGGSALLAVFGQCFLLIWSVFLAPTSGREAMERGILPTSQSVPQTLAALSSGNPLDQLEHTLDIFPACEWINTHSAASNGAILIDETRGFYLDRPYLWGNTQHSSYIPYESMRTGKELNDWFRGRHYYYGLINLKFSPGAGNDTALPNGPVGNEESAFQRWYATASNGMEHWRFLVSDAIQNCGWSFVYGHSGVAVVQFGDVSAQSLDRQDRHAGGKALASGTKGVQAGGRG